MRIRILFPLTTFAALYISINVLCYALSFHLSDTILLARLNLSMISMAAKFESLNLENLFTTEQFLKHQNQWMNPSLKLMSSTWTCSHNENANDYLIVYIFASGFWYHYSVIQWILRKYRFIFSIYIFVLLNVFKLLNIIQSNIIIQSFILPLHIFTNLHATYFKLCVRLGSEQNYLASFA